MFLYLPILLIIYTHMKNLPDILSEGLLTDRNISIQMNDLTARTVAAALYNPSDDTFRKIRAYLNRNRSALDHIGGTRIIDKYIQKQHEVLMTLTKVSASAFFLTVIPDPNIRYQIYTPDNGCLNRYLDVEWTRKYNHGVAHNETVLNLASNIYSLGKRSDKDVQELIAWMDENCVDG